MISRPEPTKGKRRTQHPCPKCFLHLTRCICHHIPSLDLKTRVSLVTHFRELKKTTNTGRLAVESLTNSELIVRGLVHNPVDLGCILQHQYRSVIFYPAEGALELTEAFVKEGLLPLHLIVPDGNWRQASKIHHRHSELAHLPRVMIKVPNLEKQHIRKETTAEGMATLQAIAHALGITEGHAVKKVLLNLYHQKLEQTLRARGMWSPTKDIQN